MCGHWTRAAGPLLHHGHQSPLTRHTDTPRGDDAVPVTVRCTTHMSRPSCILALPARRSINVVSRQRERTELCSRRRCPSHHCAHAHLALRVCTEQPSDTPACAWRSSRDWHRLRHGHVDGAACSLHCMLYSTSTLVCLLNSSTADDHHRRRSSVQPTSKCN